MDGNQGGEQGTLPAASTHLGSYTGFLSLHRIRDRPVMPERAALRGKRLVLAEEMPNHALLSSSVVKQLCSTDAIHAEQKFKDPFTFKPSHTLVLMTNSLPEIRDRDEGI